jgi:hypothetical protein
MEALNESKASDCEVKDNLALISQIAFSLRGRTDVVAEDVRLVAANTIQCIKQLDDSDQPKMIYLICKTLELTLQD